MGSSPAGFITLQVFNGLAYGLLLFVMAAGLSLIFGLMDVLNLAHGSFYLVGGYIALSIVRVTGSFWLGLLVAPLLIGGLGWLLERGLLRPLKGRGHLDQVLLTYGIAYIFTDMTRLVWGGDVLSIQPPAVLAGSAMIFGSPYPVYRLFVIGVCLLIAACFWWFQERTRIGAIVRAGVSDAEMVRGLGVRISLVVSLMFAVGSMLAGLGGVVAAPVRGLHLGLDFETLILTLMVVVVGGLGTLSGSFWGAILIGQIDTLGKVLFPNYAEFATYGLMALVLIIKPSGLFGKRWAA